MTTPATKTHAYLAHWYTFPKEVIEAAVRDGMSTKEAPHPTGIAIRALSGEDYERAAAQSATGISYRLQTVTLAICGVNFAADAPESADQTVSSFSTDPNLIPANVYKILHSQALTMVERAFAEVNDARQGQLDDFMKTKRSKSVTV